MGFAYVEPTIEELNRRIATGQVFVQSDLSGTYTEKYYDYTPAELQLQSGGPANVAGYGEGTPGELAGVLPGVALISAEVPPAPAPVVSPPSLYEMIAGKPPPAWLPGTQEKPEILKIVEPALNVIAPVLPVGAAATLLKTGSSAEKLPAVVSGIQTGLAGGGWGPALTAGLGLIGLGGTAATILGLAGQVFGGDFLGGVGGGGGGPLIQNGGGAMTTGTIVNNGTAVQGVPFGGPGVPEPPAGMVAKAWKTKSFSNSVGEYWVYHWILLDGRRLTWNAAKRQAKIWRPQKNITLGPKPKVKDLIRINRSVNRLNKGLKKQLKRAGVEL